MDRGALYSVERGGVTLATIALLGYMYNIIIGIVLIPILRYSMLASFFSLSISTTLTFYILTIYSLFALVLMYRILYIS
jgi:hypothetical protein